MTVRGGHDGPSSGVTSSPSGDGPIGGSVDESVPVAETFEQWVRPHWAALQRLVSRLVSTADMDDVLQESVERAWRKWHTFDGDRGTPRSWLLAIAADRARRHRLRSKPATAPVDDETPDAARDIAGDVALRAAVAQLSPRRRLAVDLHYYVGLPITEMAVVMRCSEGTAKSTLSAARVDLRAILDRQDFEEHTR